MIVVSGTISTPCKNVTSRYDEVSDVSVPSGRPDASMLSIMWLSSLTPIDKSAGRASTISLWKRLSRKSITG